MSRGIPEVVFSSTVGLAFFSHAGRITRVI